MLVPEIQNYIVILFIYSIICGGNQNIYFRVVFHGIKHTPNFT